MFADIALAETLIGAEQFGRHRLMGDVVFVNDADINEPSAYSLWGSLMIPGRPLKVVKVNCRTCGARHHPKVCDYCGTPNS